MYQNQQQQAPAPQIVMPMQVQLLDTNGLQTGNTLLFKKNIVA
jgi:hypothetical protein